MHERDRSHGAEPVTTARWRANGIRSTSTGSSPAASTASTVASTLSRVAATSRPRSTGLPSSAVSSIGKKSSSASSTGSGRTSCTWNGSVSRMRPIDIFGTVSSRISTCELPMPMITLCEVKFASVHSRRRADATGPCRRRRRGHRARGWRSGGSARSGGAGAPPTSAARITPRPKSIPTTSGRISFLRFSSCEPDEVEVGGAERRAGEDADPRAAEHPRPERDVRFRVDRRGDDQGDAGDPAEDEGRERADEQLGDPGLAEEQAEHARELHVAEPHARPASRSRGRSRRGTSPLRR